MSDEEFLIRLVEILQGLEDEHLQMFKVVIEEEELSRAKETV